MKRISEMLYPNNIDKSKMITFMTPESIYIETLEWNRITDAINQLIKSKVWRYIIIGAEGKQNIPGLDSSQKKNLLENFKDKVKIEDGRYENIKCFVAIVHPKTPRRFCICLFYDDLYGFLSHKGVQNSVSYRNVMIKMENLSNIHNLPISKRRMIEIVDAYKAIDVVGKAELRTYKKKKIKRRFTFLVDESNLAKDPIRREVLSRISMGNADSHRIKHMDIIKNLEKSTNSHIGITVPDKKGAKGIGGGIKGKLGFEVEQEDPNKAEREARQKAYQQKQYQIVDKISDLLEEKYNDFTHNKRSKRTSKTMEKRRPVSRFCPYNGSITCRS